MRMITAIVQPYVVDDILDSLGDADIHGVTVINAQGYGRKTCDETYRGSKIKIKLTHKVKLDIAVSVENVEKTIEIIKKTAHSGSTGDGKIFVTNLEKVIRIRTGEEDREAL
jgi:nitrogen regulatory protein PII